MQQASLEVFRLRENPSSWVRHYEQAKGSQDMRELGFK